MMSMRAGGTVTPDRGRQVEPVREAVRQRTARLLDPRLLGGVALIGLSALAGALLLGHDEDTVTVWRATRDLSVGATIADVEPVAVPRSLVADRYVASAEDITGVLNRAVAAGELIPASAVGTSGAEGVRLVTIPVDPLHAPPDLLAGDAVDVWASGDGQSTQSPELVLADVVVSGVSAQESGLTGQLGVVLRVPDAQVAAVVAASRRGALDLVAVPLDAQASTAVVS